MRLRTWHVELGLVALLMIAVAADSGRADEFLGAVAVTLTFAHTQVADRLAEKEKERAHQSVHALNFAPHDVNAVRQYSAARSIVECHEWLARYLVMKELVWVAYFISRGAWSAIVGAGLFLLYPLWRKWYRASQQVRH